MFKPSEFLAMIAGLTKMGALGSASRMNEKISKTGKGRIRQRAKRGSARRERRRKAAAASRRANRHQKRGG